MGFLGDCVCLLCAQPACGAVALALEALYHGTRDREAQPCTDLMIEFGSFVRPCLSTVINERSSSRYTAGTAVVAVVLSMVGTVARSATVWSTCEWRGGRTLVALPYASNRSPRMSPAAARPAKNSIHGDGETHASWIHLARVRIA